MKNEFARKDDKMQDEKNVGTMPKKEKIKFFSACPPVCFGFFVFALAAGIIHIISVCSTGFADFFNRNIASAFRFVLAKLTGWIPFSFAEMIIYALPLLLAMLVVIGLRTVKSNKKYAYTRYICGLLSIISVFYSLFVFTLGTGYQASTLYEKMGVTKPKYENSDDLVALAEYLRDGANECAENIVFSETNGSLMPYSREELNDLLNDACIKASEKYDFISPMRSNFKHIIISPLMTYTHISGVYTYYTGESNINTNFPDYTVPYTAAHEMAHQRGIAREDEANFVAYLICMESDDNYIRYSAYVNLLEYVQSALNKADRNAYREFYRTLGQEIILEQRLYNEFFDKYRENVAEKVSGAVNNAYLQSQGQSAGTVTYSYVVGLALACIDFGK